MSKKYPFYQPEGPYTFSKWEDKPNTGDQLWLSAVWTNAKGEEYRVQARYVADIMAGVVTPMSQQKTGNHVPTYPEAELEKAARAYQSYMKGRNRPDLGAAGSDKPPFKLAA